MCREVQPHLLLDRVSRLVGGLADLVRHLWRIVGRVPGHILRLCSSAEELTPEDVPSFGITASLADPCVRSTTRTTPPPSPVATCRAAVGKTQYMYIQPLCF
jgi:hypothetical protein